MRLPKKLRPTDYGPSFERDLKDPRFLSIADTLQLFTGWQTWPCAEDFPLDFTNTLKAVGFSIWWQTSLPEEIGFYDRQVAEHGLIPTRPGHAHDFFNLLIFAAYPLTKKRLHTLQLAEIKKNPTPHRRSRPCDLLTLFDEGGVALGSDGTRHYFGHALFEHYDKDPSSDTRGFVVKVDDRARSIDEATALVLPLVAEGKANTERVIRDIPSGI